MSPAKQRNSAHHIDHEKISSQTGWFCSIHLIISTKAIDLQKCKCVLPFASLQQFQNLSSYSAYKALYAPNINITQVDEPKERRLRLPEAILVLFFVVRSSKFPSLSNSGGCDRVFHAPELFAVASVSDIQPREI